MGSASTKEKDAASDPAAPGGRGGAEDGEGASAGENGGARRVFDDGVGRRKVQPFFSATPCPDMLKTLQQDFLPTLDQQIPFFVITPGCPIEFMYASTSLCTLTGYSDKELLQSSPSALLNEELSEEDDQLWTKIENSITWGQELVNDFTIRTKSAQRIHTRLHLLPIQNSIGRLVFYVGTLTEHSFLVTQEDSLNTSPPTHPSQPSSSPPTSAVRDADAVADAVERRMGWRTDLTRAKLRQLGRIPFPEGFVISDPWRPDNPLVWCSPHFYQMTGYAAAEILGRNCRFLQGEETDQEEIDKMRVGIKGFRPVTACFRNYRKDGAGFWNHISVYPVMDETGNCAYFSAMQYDASWLMDIVMSQGEEGIPADDERAAGLDKIDEIQVEINLVVRDILLGQLKEGWEEAGGWKLKSGALVDPSGWEQQVRTGVAIRSATAASLKAFEEHAAASRLACSVWE